MIETRSRMSFEDAKSIHLYMRTGLFVFVYINAVHERNEEKENDVKFMARLQAMLIAYKKRDPEEHAATVAKMLREEEAATSTKGTKSKSITNVRFFQLTIIYPSKPIYHI